MTINNIASVTFGVAFVFSAVLAMSSFAPATVYAQAFDYGCCSDYSYDWGGTDYSYDWGSDYSYDWGGDYSYDWGSDYAYDWGSDYSYDWGGDYAYDWGGDYTYDWGGNWYDDTSDYAYDWGGNWYDDVTGTYYDDVYGSYYDDVAGTYYDDVYGTYYDDYAGYSTPSCSSCGGSFGGFGGFGGHARSSTPVIPITISTPARPSTPVYGGGSTIVNTNTNTNINNSINGSFNNYNSGNVTIATVSPATPQYPVVYQAPSCVINHALAGGYGSSNMAYLSWSSQNATSAHLTNIGSVAVNGNQTVYPTVTTTYTLTVYNAQGQAANCSTTVVATQAPVQNTYCSIYATPSTIQNGQSSTLTWNSTGATSAWLSDGIGSVAVNGSLAVRPESSRTYTLTVYGSQGTKTCSTTVNVQGAYVSLTQIPYTGFDLGPMGNAMYWLGLITFAIAGAYLAIYYVPNMMGRANVFAFAAARPQFKPVAFKAETPAENPVAENVQPIVASIRKSTTVDSMAIVQSKDGSMPKIVINRS